MPHDVLMIVEIAEELLGVFIDVFRLLQETRAKEVIEYLPEFRVALQIVHMLFFDCMFNGAKVSLQLGVKVLIALHFATDVFETIFKIINQD